MMLSSKAVDDEMSHEKKRIVMCGCHVAGEAVVRGLLDAGIEFAAFVCLTPEQAVREKVSGFLISGPWRKNWECRSTFRGNAA